MIHYTFRLFGITVFTVEVAHYELEEEESIIEGGSAHNFERDYEPLSPTSHHEWEWEDRKKGFGFR
jgi:hypothetical protein